MMSLLKNVSALYRKYLTIMLLIISSHKEQLDKVVFDYQLPLVRCKLKKFDFLPTIIRCLQRKRSSTEEVKFLRAARVLQCYKSIVKLCEIFRATRVPQNYETSLELREFSPGKRGNIFKFLSSNLIVQGYRKMLYLQVAETLWTRHTIGITKSE